MKRSKLLFYVDSKMAENNAGDDKNPTNLVRQGTRAYYVREYNLAVQMFSKAIEIIATENGEKHDSLGDIYLTYGKSLLELSREEADPLGDAVPRELKTGESEDSDDDEEDADAAETADAGKEQDKPEEAKTNEKEETEGDDKVNGVDDKKEENDDDTKDAETAGSSNENKTEEKGEDITGDEVEDDNPSDLQLAWEVLELAKIIFEARGEDGEDRVSEALVALGEVAMESENFESAINDIRQGLEIQERICDQYSRRVAETNYKLGIALAANSQLEEAVDHFVKSHAILTDRVVILEKDLTNNADELKELKVLLPEIYEKIIDTRNLKNEVVKQQKETEDNKNPVPTSPDKKANDISHLVKRKRKLEDIVEAAGGGAQTAKKPSP